MGHGDQFYNNCNVEDSKYCKNDVEFECKNVVETAFLSTWTRQSFGSWKKIFASKPQGTIGLDWTCDKRNVLQNSMGDGRDGTE